MFATRNFEGLYETKRLAEAGSSDFKDYNVSTSLALKRMQLDNGGMVCVPISKLRYVKDNSGDSRIDIITQLKYLKGEPPSEAKELGNVVIFANRASPYQLLKLLKGSTMMRKYSDDSEGEVYSSADQMYALLPVVKRRAKSLRYPFTVSCSDCSSIKLLSSQGALQATIQTKAEQPGANGAVMRNPLDNGSLAWLRNEYF
jgi:hypothetical protein